jgi:hypothetical protein
LTPKRITDSFQAETLQMRIKEPRMRQLSEVKIGQCAIYALASAFFTNHPFNPTKPSQKVKKAKQIK